MVIDYCSRSLWLDGVPGELTPRPALNTATDLDVAIVGGGYVGDGVATTNLSGRTLRDLILGHDTELTALPWVGHRSPLWKREPPRWLAVNAAMKAIASADSYEERTGRPSLRATMVKRLIGA